MLAHNPSNGDTAVQVWTYQAENEVVEVQYSSAEHNAWATQKSIAQGLGLTVQAVSLQIINFKKWYAGSADRSIKDLLIVAEDGKMREVEHYDMKVINFIANRANPTPRSIAFVEWAGDMLNKAVSNRQQQSVAITPGDALVEMALAYREHERQIAQQNARLNALEAGWEASGMSAPDWFAVVGYASHIGKSLNEDQARAIGKIASPWCRQNGITPGTVRHPLYGKQNTYPVAALEYAFALYFKPNNPASIISPVLPRLFD